MGWEGSRIGNGLLRSKEAFLLNRGEIEYRLGRQILNNDLVPKGLDLFGQTGERSRDPLTHMK